MTTNKKYIVGLGLMAIIIALGLFSINQNGNKDSKNSELGSDIASTERMDSAESQVFSAAKATDATSVSKVESAEVVKELEVEADINVLINQYFNLTGDYNIDILTSRTKEDKEKGQQIFDRKKEIIEKYENVTGVIKPGQTEGTYIVFTTYDIKLKKVETLVPGMSVLIINKDDSGKLLINNTPNDESLTNYINQVASEEELKTMIDKVNKNLSAAIKKDSSLKQLVEYLKELS